MAKKADKTCKDMGYCFCKGLAAIIIIVLVWVLQDPRIWVTILAGLILLGAGGCMCKKKCLSK